MITDKKWKELVKKWEAVGPVYQIPRRSHDRLKHFCDNCVPLLKDKRVLEIGANAGVFGLCISEVAENYIGVEPGNKISRKKKNKTDYFKQALITEKELKSDGMFINMTVKEAFGGSADLIYDTLVMCYALYHLSDKEIELLKEKILPKCDLVIIQNREQPRKTKHNKFKFYKSKRVVKFFQDQGYDVELIWGEDRGTKKAFSEIICKRPVYNEKKSTTSTKTILDHQGGIVPKKKSVKKKSAKKVIAKNVDTGKSQADNAGETPVPSGPDTPQG